MDCKFVCLKVKNERDVSHADEELRSVFANLADIVMWAD